MHSNTLVYAEKREWPWPWAWAYLEGLLYVPFRLFLWYIQVRYEGDEENAQVSPHYKYVSDQANCNLELTLHSSEHGS